MNYTGPPPHAGMSKEELHEMTVRVVQDTLWRSAAHIYVFTAREFTKIGVAVDVERRWRALRCANPMLDRPLYVTPLIRRATDLELQIHKSLAAHRVKGTEWFTCTSDIVVQVVQDLYRTSANFDLSISR